MNSRELKIAVKLSCQRALLGAITPNTRLITVKYHELKEFFFRVYFASQPSDEDIDEMEAVIAEIVSDIPFEKDHGAECLVDDRARKELELYDIVIYARKE